MPKLKTCPLFRDLWMDWEHRGWRQASRWLRARERTVYSGHMAEVSVAETEQVAVRRSRSDRGGKQVSGRPQEDLRGSPPPTERGPHFCSCYPEVSIPASRCCGWWWESLLRGGTMRLTPPGQRKSPDPLLPLHVGQLKDSPSNKGLVLLHKEAEGEQNNPICGQDGVFSPAFWLSTLKVFVPGEQRKDKSLKAWEGSTRSAL